jgi:hypothetical protein
MAGVAEHLSSVRAEPRADQNLGGRRAEGLRTDDRWARLQREGAKQLRRGGLLAASGGDCDRHRHSVQPAGEMDQEPQRRAVGPVDIVDDEQQWRELGEVGNEPVEAVEGRLGRVGRTRAPARRRREGGLREAGRPGEQIRARVRIAPLEDGFEELTDNPEAEIALELATPRREDPHPDLLGVRTALVEEARLANPGRTLDQCQAAVASARIVDEASELAQLAFALNEGPVLHLARRNLFGQPFGRNPVDPPRFRADHPAP